MSLATQITSLATRIATEFKSVRTAIAATYTKPAGGIPKTDLATAVQTSLGKADTALQAAPVTSVNTKTGAVTLAASDVSAIPTTADITAVVKITAAAYAALGTKSATTLYVIVG